MIITTQFVGGRIARQSLFMSSIDNKWDRMIPFIYVAVISNPEVSLEVFATT